LRDQSIKALVDNRIIFELLIDILSSCVKYALRWTSVRVATLDKYVMINLLRGSYYKHIIMYKAAYDSEVIRFQSAVFRF